MPQVHLTEGLFYSETNFLQSLRLALRATSLYTREAWETIVFFFWLFLFVSLDL